MNGENEIRFIFVNGFYIAFPITIPYSFLVTIVSTAFPRFEALEPAI